MAVADDADVPGPEWDGARADLGRRTCPRPEVLRAELEGVLPEDLAARVQTHMSSCRWCRRLRESLAELDVEPVTDFERQRIRARVNAGTRPKGMMRRARIWAPLLAAAAIVALAVWVPRPVVPPLPPAPNF